MLRAVLDEEFSSAFSVVTKVKNWCLFTKMMFIYKFSLSDWQLVCRYLDENVTLGEGTRSENVNKQRKFVTCLTSDN